jgi:hypothetical protein
MPTASEPRIEDIPRIAFVTRRFHELQGLTTAMLGVSLIVASLTAHAMEAGYPAPLLQTWNFAILPCILMVIQLQRMYRHSFGEAVGTSRQQFAGAMPMVAVFVGGMADLSGVAHSGPSMAAVGLASCSLWIVARDWRWRIHHLVPAAAGIIAAMVTAGAPPVLSLIATDPVRTETYLLSFTILGLGMVAAGVLDHRLLVSSFACHLTSGRGAGLALARANSGWIRAAIAGTVCVTYGGTLWLLDPGNAYFALWLGLVAALGFFQVVLALFQISRAVRRRRAAAAVPPVLRLYLRSDSLALMLVLALATAVQSALDPERVTLVAVAIGAASLWVAVRDWPYRGHYLIGTLAAVTAIILSRADPVRSLSILIFSTSGALMLEGLLDHFVATRHCRIHDPSAHEAVNADAI